MPRFLVAFLLLQLLVSAFQLSPRPMQGSRSRRLHTNPPLIVKTANFITEEPSSSTWPTWQSAIQELERTNQIAKQQDFATPTGGLYTAAAAVVAVLPRPLDYPVAGDPREETPNEGLIKRQSENNGFRSLQRNDTRTQTSLEGGDMVCRVIARSDGKLPAAQEMISLVRAIPHDILRRLDDIYHAQAHDETRLLQYMQRPSKADDTNNSDDDDDDVGAFDAEEENILVATVRTSLEDAGFELLSRRDLDLCEALNTGYLLRLSILPDVSKMDPSIAQDFYPEHFDANGNVLDPTALSEKLLFDGRVLVFWRGYSQEVTRGRLLLPKLDYLQASLVQRLSGSLRTQLGLFERYAVINSLAAYRKATACFLSYMRHLADRVPNENVMKRLRRMMRSPYFYSAYKVLNNGTLPSVSQMRAAAEARGNMFKLSRYGGSKIKFVGSPNPMDALNPFIICEQSAGRPCEPCKSIPRAQKVNRDMYESLGNNELRCPYDAQVGNSLPPMQLLERVSISNLVDIFTKEGRRNLRKTVFSKSELVEPTYEEVVVVWRPMPEKKESRTGPHFTPPKIVYELADMFDIEGLPAIRKEPTMPTVSPLEIRTFEGVPMANLPAVLPKTKLVFRPADAFVFDLVSILSFLAIAGSLKFDNPKLDLIALVSVVLWVIRTVIRYSNKLARYDLLVKNFLTSKISHRNAGALRYLATEAGSQRATRAALVHTWLTNKIPVREEPLLRSHLIARGKREIHDLLNDLKRTPVDIDATLNDLEDLELVKRIDAEGRLLEVVRDDVSVVRVLKQTWGSLFDGKVTLKALIGRRNKGIAP